MATDTKQNVVLRPDKQQALTPGLQESRRMEIT